MEFKLKAGASIDLLTKGEVDDSLKTALADFEVAQLTGLKPIRNIGRQVGASLSTTAYYVVNWTPNQGYIWSLRLASANLGTAANALFLLATDTTTTPAIAGLAPIDGGSPSGLVSGATFAKGQVLLYPGEYVAIAASASATLNSYMLTAWEAPAELIGKLA